MSCTMVSIFFLVGIFISVFLTVYAISFKYYDLVPKTITEQGYPFENHTTVTEDGYILGIFRIPHRGNESEYTRRTPVVISHGFFGFSLDYLLLGPKHGLAFILADSGFDVWLMNSRGTRYSRKHLELNDTQSEFWNYSYHEIGVYDTPAVIDYILNFTKYEELVHIGHSHGVTSLFVMLSEIPEYNKKVKAHIAMSPGVYYCNYKVEGLRDLAMMERLGTLSDMRREMGDFNLGEYFSKMCTFLPEVCGQIVESREVLPEKFKTAFFRYYPDGGSFKQAIHSSQAIAWCTFGPYVENIENPPPLYNLSNVVAPIYAFYGDKDTNVNAVDVIDLGKDLPGGFAKAVLLKNWRHLDFMLSSKARKRVYLKMVDIINSL